MFVCSYLLSFLIDVGGDTVITAAAVNITNTFSHCQVQQGRFGTLHGNIGTIIMVSYHDHMQLNYLYPSFCKSNYCC